MSSWDFWINEPVFYNKGVSVILKRKQALFSFVREGIVPLLQAKGYKLLYSDGQVTRILLNLLMTAQDGKSVRPVTRTDDIYEDHYVLYCHLLDSEVWERFWKAWDGFQDFEEGTPGYKVRFAFPDILWPWIDLESSPVAIQLEKALKEQEAQEEFSKGKDDPYLQENAKRDYQDRHW
jgi:hypothetical protein